jgi:hypothetical protein
LATAGDASAVVSWAAPACDGGSGISGYLVRVVDTATSTQVGALRPSPADATSLKVTGLTNATAYTFQIQATNVAGSGPSSAMSNAATPAAAVRAGVSDFNGDGFTDLVARDASGALWLYPGDGGGGFLGRVQLATGWGGFTAIVSPGM